MSRERQKNQPYSGTDNLEVMREAENYNRYLLKTVRYYMPARAHVLDFGAGNGQFSLPLRDLGVDVTAIEPDDALRSKLVSCGLSVADSPNALKNDSIDYIYSLNVLEHIEDDVGALRTLHAKLAPGGKLLIYVPAFPLLYTSMDAKVGHVRRYTRRSLARVVTAAGFTVQRLAYVDSLGFFATLLFKLTGDEQGSVNRTALKFYDRVVFPVSRIIDGLAQHWIGKNLLLLARKRVGH